jgi:release factor glutamine methyltransferase
MSAAPSMIAPARDDGITVGEALAEAISTLAAAGIDAPRREARLLLATVLGSDSGAVIGNPDRVLSAIERGRFSALVARRASREPAARLLGRREFWSLDFALSPATLVPRPDSETLVEAVLARIGARGAALRLLDFGTGSGCLLLALLSELPGASGIGVDIAPEAALTARRNAICLGLADRADFVAGTWGTGIIGEFDVIVANPPYVPSGTIALLAPEVALHDPRRALDGGPDGLDSYRVLAPETARLLRKGGFATFELGAGQAQPVLALMRQAGLATVEILRDLAGIERCLVVCRD